MKLTQVLCRKRKMIRKPQSFLRNWMWNNSWYLGQERPVRNFNIKESLEERSIPIHQLDDLLSPIHYQDPPPPIHLDTRIKELKRDCTHPLWKEEPVYSYGDRSWQPRDCELMFAQALTNSNLVDSLPQTIITKYNNTQIPEDSEERVSRLVKSCFIGDAVQRRLPRNFKVPYIGWHPVESVMRPRNQYDWQAFSWGRRVPREYGVSNARKLNNLSRGLFKEIALNAGTSVAGQQFIEDNKIRQFVRDPEGRLVRFFLTLPFAVISSKPIEGGNITSSQVGSSVPVVSPLSPCTGLKKENIYELSNNFPVTSTSHSKHHIHTVMRHYTDHIAPKFEEDKEQAKCLIYAYATAVGQARLLYGEDVAGDLKVPITINSITTNGPKFILSQFTLNSMDLASSKSNTFSVHPSTLDLFQFCGLDDATVTLRGLNLDTFRWLTAMLSEEKSSSSIKMKSAN